MRIPVLNTPRLILRGFEAGDWDAYAEMNADRTVRQWLGGSILTRTQTWSQMETMLGHWALRGYGMFAVVLGGTFIGRIGILHPADRVEPELAWSLAAPFWGNGFATEAAGRVRDWVFETSARERLVSYIVPENSGSRRVAEKLGAVRESVDVIGGFGSEVWVHRRPATGVIA